MSSVNTRKGLGRVILAAWLSAVVFSTSSQALAATDVSGSPQTKATTDKNLSLPPALEAIARMAEAKVGSRTILAFIASSPVAYHPGARDIITLKERGVPDEVLTALLEHGAKIRAKSESSAAARNALNAPERRPLRRPRPPSPAPVPVYVPYPVPIFPPYGPVTSFNNTYPTYINGRPVYSGYYVPGYGYLY